MTEHLPIWLGGLLALVLLAGVMALPIVFLVMPLLDAYAEVDAGIIDAQDQILRMNSVAMDRAAIEQEMALLNDFPITVPYYLPGETDSLAAAALQARIQQLATNFSIQVRSIQVLPVETGNGFNRIGIRAEVLGSTDGLVRLIYDLETAAPYLFVDALDAQGPAEARNGSRPQAEPQLAMTLQVSGYRLAIDP